MKQIIGIDIGKAELVVFWQGKNFNILNECVTIKKWLQEHHVSLQQVSLIVFEPTGGYENKLINVLTLMDLPYRMVHANHVRAYAKATGLLAKTDRIDARIIADFAKAMNLEPKAKFNQYTELKERLNRRDQLVYIRAQEKNRLEVVSSIMQKDIESHIKWLSKKIEKIETNMDTNIKQANQLEELIDLLQSIPGIGKLTAIRIAVDLPELTSLPFKKLAALVGVAPLNHDSGKIRGKRYIRGGRSKIRSALYLSTLSAIRYNSVIKAYYQKLRQKGKPGKVAMVAAIHKLLAIIKSVADRKTPWVEIVC